MFIVLQKVITFDQKYRKMTLIHIIIGSVLIILGFLVKKFPNLIAGYNSLQGEHKKEIDIEGLSGYVRNGLIIIGVLIIAGYFAIQYTAFTHFTPFIIMFFLLGGGLALRSGSQKFNKSHPKYKGK
jgi:undecaprenyl pyrophosphate phosphatase UppP